MKVFFITVDEVFDYATFQTMPYATTNKEKAKEKFNNLVEDAKKAYPNWTIEEGEDNTTLFLNGEYSSNHCEISLYEIDVEE